tara:strand:- start:410 stop:925 length:516 start_codon:yes stop_codon:yes gene_type:complete
MLNSVHLQYGGIDTNVAWKCPTQSIFDEWKKDFLKIKETKFFDIYLCGGFIENWKTSDIDIVITGNDDVKKIEKVIFEGTKLGIEKYQVFFDVLWEDTLPLYYKMKINEIKKVKVGIISNKYIINNKVITYYKHAKQISKNLWMMNSVFPTRKQQQRIKNGYIYTKPIKIC